MVRPSVDNVLLLLAVINVMSNSKRCLYCPFVCESDQLLVYHFIDRHRCWSAAAKSEKATCPHCNVVTDDIWTHLNLFHLSRCFICGESGSGIFNFDKEKHRTCEKLVLEMIPVYLQYVIFS